MSEFLSKGNRLLMVSDTAMFRHNGQNYALGPVVREIQALLPLFDQVTWIGFDKPEYQEDPSFSLVEHPKIRLILLEKCGGDRFIDKIGVLIRTPWMSLKIALEMSRHSVIYTRAPSVPAFLATIWSFFFFKKTIWHKYAGNWIQDPAPKFFALQRSLLKRIRNAKVTINGSWPDQPAHCLSFENPCLKQFECIQGEQYVAKKEYSNPLHFCFVGRLEQAKGVNWILEAFKKLENNPRIGSLHLVGDGPMREACAQFAVNSKIPVQVHGFLGQQEVSQIMAQCHFLLLPSASEGFPKVVAEAANWGCIPIVTDVSCISQYIQDREHGFLLNPLLLPEGQLASVINRLPEAGTLKKIALKTQAICKRFTYTHFVNRVKDEILKQP